MKMSNFVTNRSRNPPTLAAVFFAWPFSPPENSYAQASFRSCLAAAVAGCATGPRPACFADTLATQSGPTGRRKASGLFSVFAPIHDAFSKAPAVTTKTLARLFDEALDALEGWRLG